MLFRINIIAVSLAAFLAAAPVIANESGCVTKFDPSKDYFPDKVTTKYGAGFEISYNKNYKVIRNLVSNENYILVQCGTPAPADHPATDATSTQVGDWTKVFDVPAKKVALDSAPASAILELLGEQNSVGASYKFLEVTSPCMQKRLDGLPRIQQNFGTPKTKNSRRAILTPRVSYDLGDNVLDWTFTTYGMSDPYSVAVNPESATDMLGKAEWIKFVGAFYNREADANKLFEGIESRYACLQDHAKSTGLTKQTKTVGFARYNRVPNGTVTSWTVDQGQQWFVQGLADAGLTVHAGDVTGYSNVDSFHKAIGDWDVLIDMSTEPLKRGGATIPLWDNLVDGYQFNGNQKLRVVADNSIYRTDHISSVNNATDFNEHLQIQPDLLLADFIRIHAANDGTTEAIWHRNLPKQAPVSWLSADNCQNMADK
ncbi:hypothetical protein EC988_001580, partial [Linderina pennispora]